MRTAFYLFIVSFLAATFMVAPFLKEKSHQNTDIVSIKPVTKQDIRTFLESVHPAILRLVDAQQREIHVLMSIPKEIELLDLSKRPDFNKFLSFEQNHDANNMNDYINDSNDFGWKADYLIHPKDALIK